MNKTVLLCSRNIARQTFGNARPSVFVGVLAMLMAIGCSGEGVVEGHPGSGSGGRSTVATSGSGGSGDGTSTSTTNSTGPGPTVGPTTGAGGSGSSATGGAGGSGMSGGSAGLGVDASLDAGKDARDATVVPRDSAINDAVYIADRAPNAAGILIHIDNECPFDLWIRGTGSGAPLQPDNRQLKTGEAQDYIAPDTWSAARVTAYKSVPPNNEIDKVEITLSAKVINYNITYVDWVGLPIEAISFGTGSDCKRVGCYLPVADLLQGCPAGLLSGSKCLSAGSYCMNQANKSTPFCHALDTTIAQCGSNATMYPGCSPGASGTPDVYACSGNFGTNPKWCAALNRGMINDPDNGDISLYYQNAPYNTYSKWVHSSCPGIYAFPYDDYGKSNESGFHSCIGGRQLNITFCPAG
jgi:hypothetical protein